jgi:hypothetical protein
MSDLCSVEGCDRQARRVGMCWAHEKRRRYRKPVSVSLPPADQSPGDRWLVLAMAVADADELPDLERALDRMRKAALAYAKRLGWHAPGKCPRRG